MCVLIAFSFISLQAATSDFNMLDSSGKKTGLWVTYLDSNLLPLPNDKKAVFYKSVVYSHTKP